MSGAVDAKKGDKGARVKGPEAEAGAHLSRGVLALATRDFATAYSELAQAYRLTPTPELLYQLGLVASAEGKTVEAHDLLRRYLAEAGQQEASATQRAEAERIVALPHGPTGQLRLTGEAGAEVLIDERLVGKLPLSQPLLLAQGSHQLALVKKTGRKQTAATVRPGGTAELVDEPAATVLQVVELKTVLPLVHQRGTATSVLPVTALHRAIESEKLALIDLEGAGMDPLPPDCWNDGSCLLRIAERSPLDLLLHVESTPTATGTHLQLGLLDVTGGTALGSAEGDCAPCTVESAQKICAELLHSVLETGKQKARGRLVVRATPASAEIRLSGWNLGKSSVEKTSLSGSYELSVSAPGYKPEKRRVTVQPDLPTSVEITLAPVPVVPDKPRPPEMRWQVQRRPTWRLVAGAGVIVGGVVMIGLGGWALSLNGGCVDEATPPLRACPALYSTTGVGAGLVAGGGALAILGGVMLALPGPRRLVPVENGMRADVTPPSKLAQRRAAR